MTEADLPTLHRTESPPRVFRQDLILSARQQYNLNKSLDSALKTEEQEPEATGNTQLQASLLANKYKDQHLKFLAELSEKKKKEKQAEQKKKELEKRRRMKLLKAVLGKEPEPLYQKLATLTKSENTDPLPAGKSSKTVVEVAPLDPMTRAQNFALIAKRHEQFLEKLHNDKKRKEEDEVGKRVKQEKLREALRKKIGLEAVSSTKDKWFGADEVEADKLKVKDKRRSISADRRRPLSRSNSLSTRIDFDKENRQEVDKEHGLSAKCTLSSAEADLVFSRLCQAKKGTAISDISDIRLFRKKHNLSEDTKIFQIVGGYPDVKKALEDRGWWFNPDSKSPHFDYRFVLKAQDIDYLNLEKHQVVNHFYHNSELTSKVGLCRNIKNVSWYEDVDVDSFFPRCYDLTIPEDRECFELDFKLTAAESILRQYNFECSDASCSLSLVDADTLRSAIRIMSWRVHELLSLCEDEDENRVPVVTSKQVTEDDWNKITSWGSISTVSVEELKRMQEDAMREDHDENSDDDVDDSDDDDVDEGDVDDDDDGVDDETTDDSDDVSGKNKFGSSPVSNKNSSEFTVVGVSSSLHGKPSPTRQVSKSPAPPNPPEQPPKPQFTLDRSHRVIVQNILAVFKNKEPQYEFNGRKNVWIVKPGRKSRGRGIQCFNNLGRLKMYTDCSRREFWVTQKYCENPLAIYKKKFDIRQWVLAVDFDPLSVFFFEKAYLRFCSVDFTLDDVENRVVHLANNCVQKHSDNFGEDSNFEGNMWHTDRFREYLLDVYGYDVWTEKIQPAMKDIVRRSLKCGQDAVQGRKNSFELFGYDFMLDEHLNVWLIEINSSPDLSYSTPVTASLVPEVSEDMMKVTVDWLSAQRQARKKGKRELVPVDTGKFTLVYRGEQTAPCAVPSMASSLVLTGTPCKIARGGKASA
eukprot:ANDGO_06460.mRNA.1 Tubulin glycylase 3B